MIEFLRRVIQKEQNLCQNIGAFCILRQAKIVLLNLVII